MDVGMGFQWELSRRLEDRGFWPSKPPTYAAVPRFSWAQVGESGGWHVGGVGLNDPKWVHVCAQGLNVGGYEPGRLLFSSLGSDASSSAAAMSEGRRPEGCP